MCYVLFLNLIPLFGIPDIFMLLMQILLKKSTQTLPKDYFIEVTFLSQNFPFWILTPSHFADQLAIYCMQSSSEMWMRRLSFLWLFLAKLASWDTRSAIQIAISTHSTIELYYNGTAFLFHWLFIIYPVIYIFSKEFNFIPIFKSLVIRRHFWYCFLG